MTNPEPEPGDREQAALERFFDMLVQRIGEHPRYGPALRGASEANRLLALDYHRHEGQTAWCVSVRTVAEQDPTGFLPADPEDELAHVSGFGQEAEHCEVLLAHLAARLMADFGFEKVPLPFFSGQPFAGGTAGG